jgi:inner membrane protein
VLAYLNGPAADLEFRRGWTHGVLALAVLPFLLAGVMLLFDRLLRRLGRAGLPSGVDPRAVLTLAFISILSHPILDTLNTYGVRWLMPFSGRWFYGDVLFIVDPWVWFVLAAGVLLSRRQRRLSGRFIEARTAPARLALGAVLGYTIAMALSGMAARKVATRELAIISGHPVESLMASPVPLNPLVRRVVAVQGGSYRDGLFDWRRRPHVDPATVRRFPRTLPSHPAVAAASATTVGRRFLQWARFPSFQVEESAEGYLVHIIDLRYTDSAASGFGSIAIPVPADRVDSSVGGNRVAEQHPLHEFGRHPSPGRGVGPGHNPEFPLHSLGALGRGTESGIGFFEQHPFAGETGFGRDRLSSSDRNRWRYRTGIELDVLGQRRLDRFGL